MTAEEKEKALQRERIIRQYKNLEAQREMILKSKRSYCFKIFFRICMWWARRKIKRIQ